MLLAGAGGMLGRDWRAAMETRGWKVIGLDRGEMDIADPRAVEAAVQAHRPDWIANAAAYTRVDDCEIHPEEAEAANHRGAAHLAQAAAQRGIPLTHLSTDYVFDGAKGAPYGEEDPPNPLSVYGATKLRGEEAVRRTAAAHQIVRTGWLYGRHGRNFVETVLELARQDGTIRMVDDQRGRPTWTVDLAEALCDRMQTRRWGVMHVTNVGECTWRGFAEAILREAGLSRRVEPITGAQLGRPARRPPDSRLDDTRGHAPLRPWPEALAEYLRRR